MKWLGSLDNSRQITNKRDIENNIAFAVTDLSHNVLLIGIFRGSPYNGKNSVSPLEVEADVIEGNTSKPTRRTLNLGYDLGVFDRSNRQCFRLRTMPF